MKSKLKRILSTLLAITMLLSQVIYADVDTGGGQWGGAFGKNDDMVVGDYTATKISLLAFPYVKEGTQPYVKGKMGQITPISSGILELEPTESIGTLSIILPYKNLNMGSASTERTFWQGSEVPVDISQKIYTGSDLDAYAREFQNSINFTSAESQDMVKRLKSTFTNTNWSDRIGGNIIEDGLGLTNTDKYANATEAQKEHNKKVIKALAKLISDKYPKVTGEVRRVLNQMMSDANSVVNNKEYMFLIEPMIDISIKGKSNSQSLIVATNVAEYYLKDSVKGVRRTSNIHKAFELLKDTPEYELHSNPVHGWRWGFDGIIGNIWSRGKLSHQFNYIGGKADTIISKIWYTGPIAYDEHKKEPIHADKETGKWGYGIIYPPDFVPTSTISVKAQLGIIDLAKDKDENTTSMLMTMGVVPDFLSNRSIFTKEEAKQTIEDLAKGTLLTVKLDNVTSKTNINNIKIDGSSHSQINNKLYQLVSALDNNYENNIGLITFYPMDVIDTRDLMPHKEELSGVGTKTDYRNAVIYRREKGHTNNSVSISPQMADVYSEAIPYTVTNINALLKLDKAQMISGGLSVLLDEVIGMTGQDLKSQLSKISNSPNNYYTLVDKFDNKSLEYGVVDNGKLKGIQIDNSKIAGSIDKNMQELFNSKSNSAIGKGKEQSPYGNSNIKWGDLLLNYDIKGNKAIKTVWNPFEQNKDYRLSIMDLSTKELLSAMTIQSVLDIEEKSADTSTSKVLTAKSLPGYVDREGEYLELSGATAINIAIQSEKIPVALEIIIKQADGTLKVLDNTLDGNMLLGYVPIDTVGQIPLKNNFTLGGKKYKYSKVAVRSAEVSPQEFNSKLSQDIIDNKITTSGNGFDVPIKDYKDMGELPILNIQARPEDVAEFSSNNNMITVVAYIEEATKDKTVVRVYEKDGEHKDTKVVVDSNDSIRVKNEDKYKVTEIVAGNKAKEPIEDTVWSNVDSIPTIPIGTGPMDVDAKNIDDSFIYIKLVETTNNTNVEQPVGNGNIELKQNEISKEFNIADMTTLGNVNTISVDSINDYLFEVSHEGEEWECSPGCKTDTHGNKYCNGHEPKRVSVVDENGISHFYKDGYYKVIYSIEQPESKISATAVKQNDKNYLVYKNNSKDATASAEFADFTLLPDIEFIGYRGKDKVTIAKYKQPLNVISSLDMAHANIPVVRVANAYMDNLGTMKFISGGEDLELSVLCNCGSVHKIPLYTGSKEYTGNLEVRKYTDTENNGINKVANQTQTPTKFSVVKDLGKFSIYPYVNMTYQNTGTQVQNAPVLAEHKSNIQINDYAEVYWSSFNTLDVLSTQWSTHKSATNGTEWRQKDSVLPGGAILGIKSKDQGTKVTVKTYQTFIDETLRQKVATEYALGDKLTKSVKELNHNNFINSLQSEISSKVKLRQYVNVNWTLNPFDGLLVDSGTNFGGKALSTDVKYWFNNAELGKNTSSGLNVANTNTAAIIYSISANTDGTVTVFQNGTAKASIAKTETIEHLLSRLPANILDVETKTKFISNFIGALERNKGTGNWYNEAWDNYSVLVTETNFNVGVFVPNARAKILDPFLTPKQESKSDMWTKAYTFGFRTGTMNLSNDIIQVNFAGIPVNIDVGYMARTYNKYYIPNVLVTDLD